MDKYKPKEFAEMVHVTVRTLQKWDVAGKLKGDETVAQILQDGASADRGTKG